jgi:hypothetical protein
MMIVQTDESRAEAVATRRRISGAAALSRADDHNARAAEAELIDDHAFALARCDSKHRTSSQSGDAVG